MNKATVPACDDTHSLTDRRSVAEELEVGNHVHAKLKKRDTAMAQAEAAERVIEILRKRAR